MASNTKVNRYRILSLIVIFAIISIIVLTNNNENIYDANHYINLSYTFSNEFGVNINNYPNTIRGYLFPFIIMLFRNVFSIFGFGCLESMNIMFVIFYSLSLWFLIPRIFRFMFDKDMNEVFVISTVALLVMFFYGTFIYALSDMTAMILMLYALYFFYKSKEVTENKISNVYYFLLGFFIYASYNTRPAYLYGGLFLILMLIIVKKFKISTIIMCMLGFILCGLPELFVNNNHHEKPSIMLNTENLYGTGESSFSYFLKEDLSVARWESNLSDQEFGSYVVFENPVGVEITRRYNIETFLPNTISNYLALFIKEPLNMLSIYFTHLINSFDSRYSEIFVTDFNSNRNLLIVINLIIIGIISVSFISNTGKNRFNIFLAIFIFLTMLPSVIVHSETRYFIFIHLLMYMYLFSINYLELIDFIKRNLILSIIAFLFVVGSFYTIWAWTLASPVIGVSIL